MSLDPEDLVPLNYYMIYRTGDNASEINRFNGPLRYVMRRQDGALIFESGGIFREVLSGENNFYRVGAAYLPWDVPDPMGNSFPIVAEPSPIDLERAWGARQWRRYVDIWGAPGLPPRASARRGYMYTPEASALPLRAQPGLLPNTPIPEGAEEVAANVARANALGRAAKKAETEAAYAAAKAAKTARTLAEFGSTRGGQRTRVKRNNRKNRRNRSYRSFKRK